MGGEVYSVRRVSDYLSSHIDLDDRIRTDMGCTQRDDGPNDVNNHHAPLSQGARNQPVYSKEQFIQESFRHYVIHQGAHNQPFYSKEQFIQDSR